MTIQQIGPLMDVAASAFDGKVVYGEKRGKAGCMYPYIVFTVFLLYSFVSNNILYALCVFIMNRKLYMELSFPNVLLAIVPAILLVFAIHCSGWSYNFYQ